MSSFTNEGTENRMMWDRSSRGFMEVWYATLTDPATGTGVWLRYTLTAPTKADRDPYCELWAFTFDAESGVDFAAKQRFGIDRLGTANGRDDGALVRIGDAWLSENHLDGAVTAAGRELSWSLDFEPADRCFQHLPLAVRRSIAKRVSTVCSPNLAVPFSGVVTLDGKKLELEGAPGGQSHRWGARHSESWTWAHCSHWEDSDAVFEGLAAQASLGPLPAPKSTFLFLRYEGRDICFNELKWAFRARSKYGLPEWSFTARNDIWKISGTAVASPLKMVQVTYSDPDGSERYCANSEVADLAIQVFERKGREWKLDGTLNAASTAHLEFGRRSRFEELPVAF